MISIKGGSELLVYGGNVGGALLEGIWKYEVDKDSWTLFGKLLNARAEHVTMSVSGIECP
jgi:hypothetical protein